MEEFDQQQQIQQEAKQSFDHLSLKEKLKHSSYDARRTGVEELIKLFKQETKFTGGVFSEHEDILPKLVGDKNVIVAEKTLEAVKIFIETYSKFSITTKEIIPILVEKSIGAPKTKKAAVEILLTCIEYELVEDVVNELVKGFEHKTPKNRQVSVEVLTEAVKTFGVPVIPIKNIIPPLIKLFDDKNAPVRKEVNTLTVELYSWIRDGIKPFIANLRPAQTKDLDKLFESVEGKPTATRFLKSYVPPVEKEENEQEEGDEDQSEAPAFEIEPPSVDILSKIKKDWFDKMISGVDASYKGPEEENPKPFKVRQDCLKELNEKLMNAPKLESGDYSNLVSAIVKVCGEPQLLVSQAALESIDYLVTGLKSEFSSYSHTVFGMVLSKLKEKRSQTVKIVHSILSNIIAHCKSITEFLDVLSEGLKNKAPNMKEQILIFIEASLSKKSKDLSKHVGSIATMIYEQFDNANPAVRTNATKAFAKLMFLCEKETKPYFNKMDDSKQKKVTEELSKFVKDVSLVPKSVVGQKKRSIDEITDPVEVPQKKQKTQKESTASSARPTLVKKTVSKESTTKSTKTQTKPVTVSTNPRYSVEEAEDKYIALVPPEIKASLYEIKWETRCKGMDDLCDFIEKLKEENKLDSNAELIIRMLQTKPSWKEANVNILVKMISTFKKLIECSTNLSGFVAVSIIEFALLKITTAKLRDSLKECLMDISMNISPQFVFTETMTRVKEIKSPTTIIEVFTWLSDAINEFGINVFTPNTIIEQLKLYVDNTNIKIKKSCISVICTMKQFVGDSIMAHFSEIKPALLSLIKDEIAKVEMITSFTPKRFIKGMETKETQTLSVDKSESKIDMNAQIVEHVKNLDQQQWKIRAEALESIEKVVDSLLSVNAQISPNISSLLQSLKKRLDTEVNLKITGSTIQLISKIATLTGNNIQKFSSIILPSLSNHLVSNKPEIRKYSIEAMESWTKASGSFTLKFFGNVLSQDKGALEGKRDILNFICNQFDLIQVKEQDHVDIKPIVNCLDSGNNEVKKFAENAIIKLIGLVGMSSMKFICKDAKSTVASSLGTIFKKASTVAEVKSEKKVQTPRKEQVAPSKQEIFTESFELLSNDGKSTREQSEKSNPWILEDSIREDLYFIVSNEAKECFSTSLHQYLFSESISEQSKGISKLKELCETNKKELIESLDVILKFCSVQLFDSKLTLKEVTLTFIAQLFQILKTQKYKLSNYEANLILPSMLEIQGHSVISLQEKVKPCVDLTTTICPQFCFHLLNAAASSNLLTRFTSLNLIINLLNEKTFDVFSFVQSESFKRIVACLDSPLKIKNSLFRALKFIYSIIGGEMFTYLRASNEDKSIIEEAVKNVKFTNNSQLKDEVETTIKELEMKPKTSYIKEVSLNQLDELFKSPLERDSFMMLLRNFNPNVTTEEDLENEIDSLKKVIAVFQTKDNSIITHLKEIVVRTSVLFAELIQRKSVNFRICKYMLSTLLALFANRQFAELMAMEDLSRLIHINLHSMTNEENILRVEGGTELMKGMNSLITEIIDNSDQTYLFSAVMKLLTHATQQELQGKYRDIVIQCILKLTKEYTTSKSKLDLDIVLLEFHEFLTIYSPTLLKDFSPMALRTIKTSLNEIVKTIGPNIRTHLSLIPTHKSPVIVSYIESMLKTTPKIQTPQKERKSMKTNSKQFVRQDQELDEIFNCIRNPDTTSSGLYKLHRFIGDHPNVDFKSHLSKCSSVFQEYVLKQLEKTKSLEAEGKQKLEQKSPLELSRSNRKLSVIPDNSSVTSSLDEKYKKLRQSIAPSTIIESQSQHTINDLSSIKSRLMALGHEKENLNEK